MGFEPVVTDTTFGDERNGKLDGILHLGDDDLAYTIHFCSRHVEVEFVVNLHDHLSLQILFFEAAMDGDHSYFDDVSSGSLNRGIDGIAFREGTDGRILGMNVRQVTLASEEGLRIAILACELFLRLNILYHAREGGKVIVDELFGFRAGAIELLGKTESGDAIYDAEIGGLGLATLVFGNLVEGYAEDLCSGCGVDVLSVAESRKKVLVLAEMRHEPEFYLAVVGGKEETTLVRNDRFADETSALGTNRQVLQVRVRRGETACGCDGLVVRSMYFSVRGNIARERRDVRCDQFAQGSIFEDQTDNRVLLLNGEQHFLRCGILSGFGFFGFRVELQFVEEQFSDLLGAVDIEGSACEVVDLLLDFVQLSIRTPAASMSRNTSTKGSSTSLYSFQRA